MNCRFQDPLFSEKSFFSCPSCQLPRKMGQHSSGVWFCKFFGNEKDCPIISKQEVEKGLNEFFVHTTLYKGVIQVIPNATYFIRGVSGEKVLDLYEKLKLNNKKFW